MVYKAKYFRLQATTKQRYKPELSEFGFVGLNGFFGLLLLGFGLWAFAHWFLLPAGLSEL
jgi:uncharacterized membrane protein